MHSQTIESLGKFHPEHDDRRMSLPKVTFSRCRVGAIIASESWHHVKGISNPCRPRKPRIPRERLYLFRGVFVHRTHRRYHSKSYDRYEMLVGGFDTSSGLTIGHPHVHTSNPRVWIGTDCSLPLQHTTDSRLACIGGL